jgi:hypothetical protein
VEQNDEGCQDALVEQNERSFLRQHLLQTLDLGLGLVRFWIGPCEFPGLRGFGLRALGDAGLGSMRRIGSVVLW